jgi:cell cycle sensor histidine kinase DivJ
VTVFVPAGQPSVEAEQPSLPLEEDKGVVEQLEAFARAALHPAYNPLEDIRHTPDIVNGFGEFVIRPPRS